jgi:hypothetical protein
MLFSKWLTRLVVSLRVLVIIGAASGATRGPVL